MENLFRRSPGAPFTPALALKVVHDVVEAHGGSMQLTSSTDEDDHGTTVELRLPMG